LKPASFIRGTGPTSSEKRMQRHLAPNQGAAVAAALLPPELAQKLLAPTGCQSLSGGSRSASELRGLKTGWIAKMSSLLVFWPGSFTLTQH